MRPYVIGLTGGMGAGKSTVVSNLRGLSSFTGNVFDCDEMVHRLYRIPAMVAWLEDKFGKIPENAGSPRAHFSKLALENPNILDELHKMFTAAIRLELQEHLLISSHGEKTKLVLVDAPLLLESGLENVCDTVIVVHCPEAIRRERIMQRAGMTEEKMNLLLARQLKDEDRLVFADHVIDTSGTMGETLTQVNNVLHAIRSKVYA